MNQFLLVCLWAGLSISAASCRKNECRDNTGFVHFSGFDSTELTSMVRTRYQRTPDFSTLISTDSSYLSPAPSQTQSGVADWSETTDTRFLNSGFNYIVNVPAAGRTYRIRDIYFDARTEKAGGLTSEIDRCCNTVHFTINDTAYIMTPPDGSERFDIILKK